LLKKDMLRKTFALEEEEVTGRREKGKKYAVDFAICSCHRIIRSDKSRLKMKETLRKGTAAET